MYNIQNMHPIWLHLVYRTQWQLGVINHVCLNYPAKLLHPQLCI